MPVIDLNIWASARDIGTYRISEGSGESLCICADLIDHLGSGESVCICADLALVYMIDKVQM